MGFTAELRRRWWGRRRGWGAVLQVGGNSRSRGALRAGSGAGTFKPCAPISCVPPLGTSLHSSFLHQLF